MKRKLAILLSSLVLPLAMAGRADTRLTLLNLTGHQVIAKNAVLVFVNVFGSWLGLIMDAPAGATSALLAGGVDQNSSAAQPGNTTSNSNTVNTINNNLELSAASGNANVTGNTQVGDATTGDAEIAVNVGNIINSEFSISDWFGVLFINVFGNWVGSLGMDTAAGNPPANQSAAISNAAGAPAQQFNASQATENISAIASKTESNMVVNTESNGSQSILSAINPSTNIADKLAYKKPADRPFSDYAFPLFGVIAISIAGALYQLSKKYSK